MAARAELLGAYNLRATLKSAGHKLGDLQSTHREVAQFVGSTAATRAPRRSGMLAASWRPGAAKTNAIVRFGGAGVPYANAVHWGTGARSGKRGPHNIAPTLFATSAAADTEPTWVPMYLEAVQTIINTVRGQ